MKDLTEMDASILKALLAARKQGLEDGAHACDEMILMAVRQNCSSIIVDTLKMAADGIRAYPQPTLEELSK